MAWQLIYTSAPRLLDAGRTGFGTVARHRAVSGLLASTIERFSQFARLPGYDTKRVVYSHRLLTVGSGEFHVLSCLRDAGSDYTGRTNHLAHHLIAEAREIRNLGLAGITPADILLGMPWLETWTSSPRFLESADEINLSTFRHPETNEWQRLTGNLHHALLPWAPSAKKGLYFVLPPGLDARPLILESLQEHPGDSWKIPFTTCLEPNDDVADFKWIAVPATSPLCPQPGTAARLILDLTRPAQLPAPPSLPTETHYSEAASAPSPATLNTPAPTAPSPDLPPPSSNPQFPSTAPVPAWSPTPAQSKKSLGLTTRLLIGSAAAIVMIGAALLISKFATQYFDDKRALLVIGEIDRIWKDQQPNLNQTLTFLKDKARTDPNLPTKLKELETQFAIVRKSLETGVPTGPTVGISMNLKSDFEQLQNAYEKWTKSRANPAFTPDWEKQDPGAILAPLKTALDNDAREWKEVARYFTGVEPPKNAWRNELHRVAIETLKNAPTSQSKAAAKEWSELLNLIDLQSPKPEWLSVWHEIGELPIGDRVAKIEELRARVEKHSDVPAWLTKFVKDELSKAQTLATRNKPLPIEQSKTDEALAKSLAASVDSPDATHPIHVLIAHGSEDIQIQANRVLTDHPFEHSSDMRLWIGSFHSPASNLEEWQNRTKIESKLSPGDIAFHKSFGGDKVIVTDAGLRLQFPLTHGVRLIASGRDVRSPEKLFDLRIKTPHSNTADLIANLPKIAVSAERVGDQLLIKKAIPVVERIRFIAPPIPPEKTSYTIVSGDGPSRFKLSGVTVGGHWVIIPNQPERNAEQKSAASIRDEIGAKTTQKTKEEKRLTDEKEKKIAKGAQSAIGQATIDRLTKDILQLNEELKDAEKRESKLQRIFPKSGEFALEVRLPTDQTDTDHHYTRLFRIDLLIQDSTTTAPK